MESLRTFSLFNKYLISIIFIFFFIETTRSQENYELWSTEGIKTEINERFSNTTRFELHSSPQLKTKYCFLESSGEYQINTLFKFSAGYRYAWIFEDEIISNEKRTTLKGTYVAFKNKHQEFSYCIYYLYRKFDDGFKNEFWNKPSYQLSYKIGTFIYKPYISPAIFYNINEKQAETFRFYTGCDIEFSKNIVIQPYYIYHHFIQKNDFINFFGITTYIQLYLHNS